nr:alcohol dehydrogenase-like 1 [Tanacetum cinerariifolium]
AVVRELGGQVIIEEINVDPPKASEVRIKMLRSSICHTDIICCKGYPLPLFPRIPGHEGVGMVESIGEDTATSLKVGDIVIPLYLGECGQCLNCKNGKTNLCHVYPVGFNGLMNDGTSRMTIAATGERIYHLASCSTWSEYMVIDVNYVLKIDPKMSLPHASLLSCGFTTGFGAPWKEAHVSKGSSVVVFGLGVVGLGAIKGAQMQGASKIIGVDINEKKAAKGKVFGMTDFINPKDHPNKSVSDLVKDITDGLGVDYSFECTGVPSLLNEALEASKIGGGTTISIGAGEINVTVNSITLFQGRTLKGTMFGGVKTQSDLPIIIQKCINKEIELDELVTHEVHLENIQEAFEILKKPDYVVEAIMLFFSSGSIPRGCNSSFIALIPKTQDAKVVKDFRPISLIGSMYKIITKILANRLSLVISDFVSDVQSAFVMNRQILKGPFILNEFLSWCLFKGIRMDDSLTLSHLFYADDVVFVRKWDISNLSTIVNVLKWFFLALGLKINLHKSKLMGIGVPNDVVVSAAWFIGCSTLYTPFNYLGFKVGRCMSRINLWDDVIAKLASRSFVKKKVGNEDLTSFWEDIWLADSPLMDLYPRLYYLEVNNNSSVATKLRDPSFISSFRRPPRGGIEDQQLKLLIDSTSSTVLPQISDRWI